MLGDSIAWGQGAAREREKLAPRLAEGLELRGFEPETRVFARPGARSSALAAQVDLALQWRPDLVVAPAPDLSAVPHVPVFLRDVVRTAGDTFREHQVAAVLAESGRIGDPEKRASRAFATDPSLFSADRFHPSSAGYSVIADSLLPAVVGAAQDLSAVPDNRT